MSTPTHIRQHIDNFVGDKPFSIRDCLIYGSRNVVDQIFHRMVKGGLIVRVARGVYIKSTAPPPSVVEIVRVKAKAFGRTVAIYDSRDTAGFDEQTITGSEFVFASNGPTSSFRVGDRSVYLIHVSYKKLKLQEA